MCDNFSKDDELWELVRHGNTIAFTQLYNRYVQLVFSEINKRIDNITDAQDITQEIFLGLWEKRETVTIENRLFSYLYGVIQNKVFNYFRSKKISAKHMDAWDKVTEEIPVQNQSYIENAVFSQLEHSIMKAEERLPHKMKTVYELRYLKDMSVEYISQHLNVSPNTIRNQLKEVRKRFHLVINKDYCLLAIIPQFYQIVNCLL